MMLLQKKVVVVYEVTNALVIQKTVTAMMDKIPTNVQNHVTD